MALEFTPTNEQGVIVLFSSQAEQAGWQFVEIGASFPDALLRFNGELWRVEFEFVASNFVAHKHDHRQCDVIICWENDYLDNPLPTIELRRVEWGNTEIRRANPLALEAEYWKRRALRAENGNVSLGKQLRLSDANSKDKRVPPQQRQAMIARSRLTSAAEIAEQFGISIRLAQYDLEAIRKASMPTNEVQN